MAPKRRHVHAVITLHDPQFSPGADYLPTATLVEVGGTVQWRCETPDYPQFEIIFTAGENPFSTPPSPELKLFGGILKPVVCDVLNKGDDFEYTIHHHHKAGGKPVTRTGFISAHQCKVCPP
jgi:hypothetical protein